MKRLFGDKKFYMMMLGVAIPIVVQNAITNFVSLLDNIMVGRVGMEEMTGIAIVNQLLLVFYLAIFGATAGAGIFGAQFYGCGDHKGVQRTFRFKLYIGLAIVLLGALLLLFFGDDLIMLYLRGEGQAVDPAVTMRYGKQYLMVMLTGLLPFTVGEIYAGTLRECGETKVPMEAGVIAVFVNLVLNYMLIFGKFGFPVLGVVGAAVATVISRCVQALVIILWTHLHARQMTFIQGAYREYKIPSMLAWKIICKGTPLMLNEILWSAGIAVLNQCYSMRGLEALAALNISGTISNLFNVVFMSMGNAIAIIVGQLLGAGKMEEAKETDARLITFSVLSCAVLGTMLYLLAPLFPKLYNTSESPNVAVLAANLLRVTACCMPIWAFLHATYFTLRTGGKTIVTFLFDSVFLWCASAPLAFVLSHYTTVPIVPLYFSCQLLDLIKCTIGFILVKKGVWLNNIVEGERTA